MFKIHWSSFMVVGFGLLLAAVGFFAEVFQAPPIPQEIAQLIKNPLPMDSLQHLKSMTFSNKNGNFKFENSNSTGDLEGPWQMTEPTNIKARKDFFIKVVKALGEIQVRHTHRSDKINLQSFSIDKPLFTIGLESSSGKSLEIAFGLINPIDNSTYFTIKSTEWIYQCTTFSIPLENVSADEILDSKALALNSEVVNLLEIHRAPFEGQGLRLVRIENDWQDDTGKKFDTRKVEAFLRDLQNLKSYMVLDKLDEAQSGELTQIMKQPAWRLRLGQGDLPETYFASNPLSSIATLKLDKNHSFLFYKEGSTQPLVIGPEQLSVINKKEKDFR